MQNNYPVSQFEKEFARYIGVRYAVSVSSGTAGLIVSMMALGLEPGDTIITTPLTFIATSNSALCAGGIPVFADVQRDTFCLDPEDTAKRITNSTKAIVGVHLYGLPFAIERFRDLVTNGRIRIVEDASQALGASINGRKVGALGDVAVFSFYETKHIRLGEGGMITTNDKEFAEHCKMIRSHGQSSKYYHKILGYNFRLPISSALIGLEQLRKIEEDIKRRVRISEIYMENLQRVDSIRLQRIDAGVRHSYYLFPLLVEKLPLRKIDALVNYVLRRTGRKLTRGYRRLVYQQQPFYRNIERLFWAAKFLKFPDYSSCSLPNAEYVVSRLVELPTDDSVSEEEADDISRTLLRGIKEST